MKYKFGTFKHYPIISINSLKGLCRWSHFSGLYLNVEWEIVILSEVRPSSYLWICENKNISPKIKRIMLHLKRFFIRSNYHWLYWVTLRAITDSVGQEGCGEMSDTRMQRPLILAGAAHVLKLPNYEAPFPQSKFILMKDANRIQYFRKVIVLIDSNI